MRLLSALALILLVSSCGPDQKAIESNKLKEVMAVHDEVMPKMSNIRKLKKALEEAISQNEILRDRVTELECLLVEACEKIR